MSESIFLIDRYEDFCHTCDKDCIIAVTTSALKYYFQSDYNYDAIDIADYLSVEDVVNNILRSRVIADDLLMQIAKFLEKQCVNFEGLSVIEVVRALYHNEIYMQNISLSALNLSLSRCCEEKNVNEIFVAANLEVSFSKIFTLKVDEALEFFFPGKIRRIDKRKAPEGAKTTGVAILYEAFVRLKRSFLRRGHKLRIMKMSIRARVNSIFSGHGIAVFSDNLWSRMYYMAPLVHALLKKGYAIRPIPKCKITLENREINLNEISAAARMHGNNDVVVFLFIEIVKDVLRRQASIQKAITTYLLWKEKNSIIAGLWGHPPVTYAFPLLFALILRDKKRVVGFQHGGPLGNHFNHEIYIRDFSRCSDFVSCGFTIEDVKQTSPGDANSINAVYPVGQIEPPEIGMARYEYDIFFPITNAVSMIRGGMKRHCPNRLAEAQFQIIEFLKKDARRTVVKPLPFSNKNNCLSFLLSEAERHIKIVREQTLKKILRHYSFKCAIIEFPSTPLYELLYCDNLELFLLLDPVMPFEKKALEKLIRRVHVFYDVKELLQAIDSFFNGQLTSKRDNSFFEAYVRGNGDYNEIMRLLA
jgi:hypothetical protein